MNCYVLKLMPCRPTFAQDMTDSERTIMRQHSAYWRELMAEGKVVVFGPVLDSHGAYGLGIVKAENKDEIDDLIAKDPAIVINQYEYHQMLAVLS
jgi:uncharacterized protein YciI